MMTKEQLEKIAKRYGIKVSYVEKGNGGFILDDSEKIMDNKYITYTYIELVKEI